MAEPKSPHTALSGEIGLNVFCCTVHWHSTLTLTFSFTILLMVSLPDSHHAFSTNKLTKPVVFVNEMQNNTILLQLVGKQISRYKSNKSQSTMIKLKDYPCQVVSNYWLTFLFAIQGRNSVCNMTTNSDNKLVFKHNSEGPNCINNRGNIKNHDTIQPDEIQKNKKMTKSTDGISRPNPGVHGDLGGHVADFSFTIDVTEVVANLSHFWKSTGFCPPDPHWKDSGYFLGKDMQLNLAYIGSLPHHAIEQVRIHWLFDSVTVSRWDGQIPVFNFTDLDLLVHQLHVNGLKPGFELMGNPSGIFSDFENKTQVFLWKILVQHTAEHFIDTYGLDYVSTWNFESWNEPKKTHFDNLTVTIQGFLNYYDASSEGLLQASRSLRLGGPGGACSDTPEPESYCWQLLFHCFNGTNYFTGERGVRLDYIAIHKKGEEPDNTKAILEKESTFLSALKENIPKFLEKQIFNDEADPLVTWSRNLWWRGDVTYAAMATKIIIAHQHHWLNHPRKKINFQLLSNDNGFLSYHPYPFTERTLLARFQINSTSPPHVQFIRKPIYSVLGLLSLLGEQQPLEVVGRHSETQLQVKTVFEKDISSNSLNKNSRSEDELQPAYTDRFVDVLSSVHIPVSDNLQDSWAFTALVYYSEDTHNTTRKSNITIKVTNIPEMSELSYVVYIMDNALSNPFNIWKAAGQPQEPPVEILQEMRDSEEPVRLIGPEPLPHFNLETQQLHVNITLLMPSVAVIHICRKSKESPSQVSNMTLYELTADQLLITWTNTAHTRCLKTFELEHALQPHGTEELKMTWLRINQKDSIYRSFVYSDKKDIIHGYYRVRAVDYWGRMGDYSPVVKF